MSLSTQEAFKVGFLARCALDGLTPEQMLQTVKQAQEALEKQAIMGLETLAGAAKGLAGYAIPAAAIAPPVLGGLAGYGLAKATDIDDTDVAEIRNRELVEEYQRQSERMKRQNAIRAYRQKRQHTGRVFM